MRSPAWVLGNGPTLPIEHLALLAGQPTIGVNRILRHGFTPTAIAWTDNSVYAEDGAAIEASGALLMTGPRMAAVQPHHVRMTFVTSERDDGRLDRWYIDGNTGTACARWLHNAGYDPVYCVGMGAAYVDGRTSSYGTNKHHGRGTIKVLAREAQLLRQQLQHHVYFTDDPGDWLLAVPRAQDEIRAEWRALLRAAGVTFADPTAPA